MALNHRANVAFTPDLRPAQVLIRITDPTIFPDYKVKGYPMHVEQLPASPNFPCVALQIFVFRIFWFLMST